MLEEQKREEQAEVKLPGDLSCVFGWGDCPVRKLLAEEMREADTMLRGVSPVRGLPKDAARSEQEFVAIIMDSMKATIQQFAATQTTQSVAQFCQACPKPRTHTLDG